MRLFVGFTFAFALATSACSESAGSSGGAGGKGGSGGSGGAKPRVPLVTAAGAPVGKPIEVMIDAKGGALTSDDGRLVITVPPGAVASATMFRVRAVTSPAPNAMGATYHLEPEKTTFAKPIAIELALPLAGVSRTGLGLDGLARRDDDSGAWSFVDGVTRDEAKKTLRAELDHFCDVSPLEGVQIAPLTTTVQLGALQQLTVVDCTDPESGELSGLVYECAQTFDFKLSDWSVEGMVGGDATHGTIQGMGATGNYAEYTAPAKAPTPNLVHASARITSKAGKTLLFSELAIGTPPSYQGPVQVYAKGTMTFVADGEIHVTPRMLTNGQYDDGIDQTAFDLSGTLTLHPDVQLAGIACKPKKATAEIGNDQLQIYKQTREIALNLDAHWDVTCTQGGQTFDAAVALQWLTGCNPGQRTFLDDFDRLQGSYFRSQSTCNLALGDTIVGWDFQRK